MNISVGLTACNALSKHFSITSIREGKTATMVWKEGKVHTPLKVTTAPASKHGTKVCFIPSKYFMGPCDIAVDELIAWLSYITFLIPSNITINFSAQRKGKESTFQKKFKNKNGLADLIRETVKATPSEIIYLKKKIAFKENYRETAISRSLNLSFAFTYTGDGSEEISQCFCNYIHNVDRGVHYDAVRQALNQFLTRETKGLLSERESKKLDIIASDCSSGLILVIDLLTDAHLHFENQTKCRLGNTELMRPLRAMAMDMIVTYFRENTKDLKRITDIVKNNAKARIKSLEVRNSVLRGETGNLDEHRISSFIPCSNGRGQYKELFLIEGERLPDYTFSSNQRGLI